MNPSQVKIIQFIKEHPAASALEIGNAQGMTAANVRHHTQLLQKAGILEIESIPPINGRGHPTHHYRLSTASQQHNLACLAELLFAVIAKKPSLSSASDLPQTLANLFWEKLGFNVAPPAKTSLTHRLNQTAAVLDPYQYQAKWEAHASAPHFILGHCPYKAILARHPELCQMDALLLTMIIGRQASQTKKTGEGSPVSTCCIFTIDMYH